MASCTRSASVWGPGKDADVSARPKAAARPVTVRGFSRAVQYETATLAPLHRVTAHAHALFRTPGNFRFKRRGVGSEKRRNWRHFAGCCHDPFRGKKRGEGVSKVRIVDRHALL